MKNTVNNKVLKSLMVFVSLLLITSCAFEPLTWLENNRERKIPLVKLSHGVDESAGGDPAYIVKTASATYYLEKQGGGLSSLLDREGVDWLGFHKKKGSGHKGEYRGFPNAVHKQDGNYFHAMNASTDISSSTVVINTTDHVQIVFTSGNGQWQAQWDFYPQRLDFTMSKVSAGFHYWVQYEGVPGGEMDKNDYWFASIDTTKHVIDEPFLGDLPAPEWFAFGDEKSPRLLYVFHHEDDEHPDNYVSRPDMTVLGFGRSNKNKFIDSEQTFSIGFVESSERGDVVLAIERIIEQSITELSINNNLKLN